MGHITGHDRSQTLLLPESLDDYVGPDNPVRFIDAFVDGLDLAAAGFADVEPKETGRQDLVSRSFGVTAATLTGWRDAFLAAGEAALTTQPTTGEARESDRLKARLGAALIERDLLNEKIAILEANRPLVRRRLRS